MKSIFLKIFMSIVVITTALNTLHAQEIITVSGKILNQSEEKNKPEPFIEMNMHVYAFNSITEAKKAITLLQNGDNNICTTQKLFQI